MIRTILVYLAAVAALNVTMFVGMMDGMCVKGSKLFKTILND
jgi:hypothetical protein